ncbi:hypothetical protein EDC04DRAFT_2605636 [Pisolithus marmoratus]|nr:hypothetical protein EDC04DRAFT_2605636 [Pisolithus marmoratus]
MLEQQQQKVRFYQQVDIVPISPCQQSKTSLDPPEEMDRLSSHSRTVSTHSPSMENLYGVLSPSPPTDMSKSVQSPSQSSNLSLFERMKRAKIPKPPSPALERVPSLQQDVAMEVAESSGDTADRALPATPNLSLFERMKCTKVPEPPSPAEERVLSLQQDMGMELAKSFGNTTARSLTPSPDLSLFERMKRAQVPKPPSPAPAPKMDLFERMQHSQSPPTPLFQTFQNAEVPSPPSLFEELDIEQGEEPDHGRSIDFGDPDWAQLQDLFKNGLMGDLPTEDEHRNLEHAGLAKADTKDDGSFAGTPHVQIVALGSPPTCQFLVGQYTVDMIDLLEVSWYPHAVSDWPARWFYNLCLDLKELEHLILVTVSQGSFTPTLPACFHAYLRCQEDMDRFQDEIRNTPLDFQQLRGRKIYPIADQYCQYKWPTKNSSMGDQIDDWIKGKVHNFMTDLQGVAEQIEVNKQDLNHLCSRWAALSRLLGRQDVA